MRLVVTKGRSSRREAEPRIVLEIGVTTRRLARLRLQKPPRDAAGRSNSRPFSPSRTATSGTGNAILFVDQHRFVPHFEAIEQFRVRLKRPP
jgi:hypothetical protein